MAYFWSQKTSPNKKCSGEAVTVMALAAAATSEKECGAAAEAVIAAWKAAVAKAKT